MSTISILETLIGLMYLTCSLRSDLPRRVDCASHIFVQEYFEEGKPRYAICNLRDEKVKLSIHQSVLDPDENKPGNLLAGPWELEPFTVRLVDAPAEDWPRGGVNHFWLNEKIHVGSMDSARSCCMQSAKGISTRSPFNISCVGIPFKRDRVTYQTGEEVVLEVIVPQSVKRVKFSKGRERATKDWRVLEGFAEKVKSTHFVVDADGDDFLLTPKDGEEEAGSKSIIVRFKAPRVAGTTLVALAGRIQSGDGNGWGWIVTSIVVKPSKEKGQSLTTSEVGAHWKDLEGSVVPDVYHSRQFLAACPADTVPFLKEKLKRLAHGDAHLLSRLLEDLDADKFAVRKAAIAELEKLGESAKGALEAKLKDNPTEDAKTHIEELLKKINKLPATPDYIRIGRAIDILERIASAKDASAKDAAADAKEFLQSLAKGCPEAHQTKLAQTALERLEAKQK